MTSVLITISGTILINRIGQLSHTSYRQNVRGGKGKRGLVAKKKGKDVEKDGERKEKTNVLRINVLTLLIKLTSLPLTLAASSRAEEPKEGSVGVEPHPTVVFC